MTTESTTFKYFWIFLAGLLVAACDLTELPQDTASQEDVFNDEIGLELYTNSFYNMLPSADNITRGDAMADYSARRDVPAFLRPGAYGPANTGGWNWGHLRNVNYFLDNNDNPDIDEEVRNHYNGIARFFRAWFYFEKVQRYGDVPWIDTALDIDDPQLFDGRDDRDFVMQRVLEDLDYAIDNITSDPEGTRTLVSVDAALALKSRAALFEGTVRTYHDHSGGIAEGLGNSAEEWLRESIDAAEELMNRGHFSIYQGGGDLSYQELFKTDSPTSQEDILVVSHDSELDVMHAANWWYTSSTYGVRLSFVRQFIHTYLNRDGTSFTSDPDFREKTFTEEVEDRDLRLSQTIRTPGFTRLDGGNLVERPPNFLYVYTGYHPHKWTLPDTSIDNWPENTNTVAIFRYAEVLLNYAEAKAELGELTASDWDMTVGELRRRAGITSGTSSLPTTVDSYLQETFFPDVNDPVLLEIRRERGIELALEGHRFYDLVRWASGDLLEMEWRGIYLPQVNAYYDLNDDGSDDVHFYTDPPAEGDRRDGVVYLDITGEGFGMSQNNELTWRVDITKEWEDHKYLYPIPENDIQTNPNLEQNPGWQ